MLKNLFTIVLTLFIGAFLFATPAPSDSLENFRKQLARDMERNMNLPPEFLAHDTCHHQTELLKVEINKSSKVIAIDFSDSAPAWVQQELTELKNKKRINYKKLDSLALKIGLHNCTLVFPLVLESDYFPCGHENKKRSLEENYFQFDGQNLKGILFFGSKINFLWSVRYIYKQ
jgi:hypothetical protein